jgi:hypothetical protein
MTISGQSGAVVNVPILTENYDVPVRIRVPPLIKVLQNAGFIPDGSLGVEVLPPQFHHNWLGEYPVEGVQSGLLHARHEVTVDVESDPFRGMPKHLGVGVDVGTITVVSSPWRQLKEGDQAAQDQAIHSIAEKGSGC